MKQLYLLISDEAIQKWGLSPHDITDNHLPTTTWAHALLGLMKYVHRDDLANFIHTSLRANIHYLEFNHGSDFVVSMLHYTLERGDLTGINLLLKLLDGIIHPTTEEKIITISDFCDGVSSDV